MPIPETHSQLALEAGRVFIPAAPIDERTLFAGRTEQLRKVFDAVEQRGQHAIIFGERGVGKTSLANMLSEILARMHAAIIAPRVNCDGSDDFSTVWRKVFSKIEIEHKSPPLGFAREDRIEVQSLVAHLPKRITPEDVRQALTMLSGQALVVVIVDEFDRVPNAAVPSLFADTIKTLSDDAVNSTVVLVGVADSVDDLIREHASIERALVQIRMPRMSADELHEIIRNGLGRLTMDIGTDALQQISLLSQGLPHYTHLLGLHSAREALDAGTKQIDLPHVKSAVEKALTQAQQSIRTAYHKATSSPRKESLFRQVLLACALAQTDDLGYFSAADVRTPMSKIMGKYHDIPSFSRHLSDFSEAVRGPILQKVGVKRRIRYRFLNPLMQPYVTMRGLAEELIGIATLEALRSASRSG